MCFCTTGWEGWWERFLSHMRTENAHASLCIHAVSPEHPLFADIWAAACQNQQSGCASSEDSDQSGHPPSLIRVFVVRMKKAWVVSYPLSAQRRLWSDLAVAQSDLSLRWAHTHCVGFVTRRLKYQKKSHFSDPVERLRVRICMSSDRKTLTQVFSWDIFSNAVHGYSCSNTRLKKHL